MKENKEFNFHAGGTKSKIDKVLTVSQLATEMFAGIFQVKKQ